MTKTRLSKNSEESEKSIESYLVRRVKEEGGLALKYFNPNATGYPDRILLFPGAPDVWVELKSKGKTTTALQLIRIQRLQSFGRMARVCKSKSDIEKLIRDIKKKYNLCNSNLTNISEEPSNG